MRLYNPDSCTPVGSSSIYVAPKGSPPRQDLPQSPTAFARKWNLQRRRRNVTVERAEAALKSSEISSPPRSTRRTSAFFDPFEIEDGMEFPSGPFVGTNISKSSSGTSATEKLTPVVSTESNELFAAATDADGFLIADSFDTRQIDFQRPVEGDLFNDASTWMTSSTLSTKFTHHEMPHVAVKAPKNLPQRVLAPVTASHNFNSRSHFPLEDGRPNEVFVGTPADTHLTSRQASFSQLRSDPATFDSASQWWKQSRSGHEASGPFSAKAVDERTAVQDGQVGNKENAPARHLPRKHVDARANHQSFSKSDFYPFELSSLDSKKDTRPMSRKVHKRDPPVSSFSTYPTKLTSSPNRQRLDPVTESETIEGNAVVQGKRARAQALESMLASRLPVQTGAKAFGQRVNDALNGKPSKQPYQIQPKDTVKEPMERNNVPSSPLRPPPKAILPSAHVTSLISSAALASGAARLKSATGTVRNQAASAGGPGSFLAERIEAKRPGSVFHGSPDDQGKSSIVKEESPSAYGNELARGQALQSMLNKRFGKKEEEPRIETKISEGLQTNRLSESADKEAVPTSATIEPDGPPLCEDPQFTKYFKMLKMGLPVDAVKNALQRDGKDPTIMDLDHNKSLKSQTKNEVIDSGIALEDDPKFAKYFKMLKMGLPQGAVKNAMERDGLDPSVLDGDHSAPVGGRKGTNKADDSCAKAPKDNFRRTRVHWETHDTVRSNTVWAMLSRDPDVAELKIDQEEFMRLFQLESSKPKAQLSPTSGTTEKGAVKVIDKKRANNGGITLARIKLSYEEIAAAVDAYDESALSQEQIRGVLQYLPTSEEKISLRNYLDGSSSRTTDTLCECEKFMVAMMNVKHAKRKLNAILYIQRFASSLAELQRDARLVQKACDEIMGSSRLRKVLGIVLNLGNRLNMAGPATKEPAGAITLDSLVKLNQPRAFDRKTTFLQYVASIVRRNNAPLCHFKDELSAVFIAEKILWESTIGELKRMEQELESVRRLALYHALESDHVKASSQGSVNGDSIAAMNIPSKLSVTEEMDLLRKTSIGKFTLDACESLAGALDEVDTAKTSYNALLRYFGEEDSSTAQPNDVFHTIVTFSKDFEAALVAVIESEKAELKEAKRQSRKQSRTLPSISEGSNGSSNSVESLRKRMATGMSGVLNELKPNLKWRRRKHVP